MAQLAGVAKLVADSRHQTITTWLFPLCFGVQF